jgi:DNA helicase INO80
MLRKYFTTNQLYTKNAAFHVCVTSYQLVVSDDKVFNRINWQYMILDEAQAIKNINSLRWNTLLAFNCRNRLLLTGTPIQNSMSELWALLHFIMPNLFDSHEQFQEWFSRDIEAHSQEKGELNQEQLKRLHKILKPFMLRRVKKDVENEIGAKTEYEISCKMTERQKLLYNSIKRKLKNISDLFNSVDSKIKVENLMNLVMQFRKVCNHPELFERHFGKVPLVFTDLTLTRSSTYINFGSIGELRCDISNAIKLKLPKLIYDECFEICEINCIEKYSIFKNKYSTLFDKEEEKNNKYGLFNFIGLFKFSLNEFLYLINSNNLISYISLVHYLSNESVIKFYYKNFDIYQENNFDTIYSSNIFSVFNSSYMNISNKNNKNKYRNFNIFINPLMILKNEEMNFFTNNHKFSYNENQPLEKLIISSSIEFKDNYLYSEFKVNQYLFFY